MVRLVKGAYWDSEIKRAQVDGQAGYPVFTRKGHTDLSLYLACAARLLAAADRDLPQFATHNAQTLASVDPDGGRGVATTSSSACTAWANRSTTSVVAPGEAGRPLPHLRAGGPPRDPAALPGAAPAGERRQQLLRQSHRRRRAVAVDALLADPLERVLAPAARHPGDPAARDLYGAARLNSAGSTSPATPLAARRRSPAPRPGRMAAGPAGGGAGTAGVSPILPADRRDRSGRWRRLADAIDGTGAAPQRGRRLGRHAGRRTRPGCCAARRRWRRRRRRAHRLCVREAGNPGRNAVAEIREAVDFCRYYAAGRAPAGRPPRRRGRWPASARGTSRWRSSSARWRRRWPPAARCWPSPPSRRR